MRKIIHVLLAGALLGALTGAAQAGKPKTVWEDAAGDADVGQGLGASIPAGVDLTGGSIAKVGKNLEFTVTHADMPPSGSLPEGARFLWAFSVNGKANYRLTVKSVDIGKPDVGAGQTDERIGRADVQGHFRLEGECVREASPAGETLSFINCPPLEYLTGSFDPASMSFTMVVPLKSIKAKPGSVIAIGGGESGSICQICWVTHYAERSLDATIIDGAAMTKTYKVPKK